MVVNSTWLIASGLANQRARKALFTCVVYTKLAYLFADITCSEKRTIFRQRIDSSTYGHCFQFPFLPPSQTLGITLEWGQPIPEGVRLRES